MRGGGRDVDVECDADEERWRACEFEVYAEDGWSFRKPGELNVGFWVRDGVDIRTKPVVAGRASGGLREGGEESVELGDCN